MINDANQYIDCPFCHAHTQTAITTSGQDKQMYVYPPRRTLSQAAKLTLVSFF